MFVQDDTLAAIPQPFPVQLIYEAYEFSLDKN
jgi:hypothetical protein